MDAEAFWRSVGDNAKKNGFSVVYGLAGGPLVIYGDRLPEKARNDDAESPFLDRQQVARMLGMHPDRMSWKPVRVQMEADGLIGQKVGGRRKMWRREDVVSYAERAGLTGKRKPGRPRKFQ